MKRTVIFSMLAMLLFSSCANRVLFSVGTRQQIENAGVDLTQIQFYNSEDIVLRRELSNAEVKVAHGKVRVENGKNIEEIIIPANTPGVCELYDEKTLKVSFDMGDGRSLPFLVERRGSMVTTDSYFKIGAKEWTRTSNGRTIGKVDYEGKVYTIVRGADARLMIDKSVLNKVKREVKVAKGRKL